jgi:ferredoxin
MPKIIVNEETCIGCGTCESVSDVFKIEDGISKVKGEYNDETKAGVDEAILSCPVQAISLEEE